LTASRSRRKQSKEGASIASAFKARKGKLSGGIIAISSAAIIAVYAIGREYSSAASNVLTSAAPAAVASVAPAAAPTQAAADSGQPTASAAATYKDGSYTGSGNSRHGGMDVTVVISGGRIISANVVSCYTRYSCGDVDPLVSEAVSMQAVPRDHVSGATDSSKAYKDALAAALEQARA
jgi:uncharacterized protein with FMN-binding domain